MRSLRRKSYRNPLAHSGARSDLVYKRVACRNILQNCLVDIMSDLFFRKYPDLRKFHLSDIRQTGKTIGHGSYGSIIEVEMPGALCAAKQIHDQFQNPDIMSERTMAELAAGFVRECQLMSTLRHPHIVLFLGVCFLSGSQMPAILMEKLLSSLHDLLDFDQYIPISLKCSILHNVASGLLFLHSQSPPIIHRDLSAKNILLNEGMVAKIGDLGMARIIPTQSSTMTKAPGATIYMPPEALEDESKYDTKIDIFSLGVLAIFALSQTFPKPLAQAYTTEGGKLVPRTELERRDSYMKQIAQELQEGHLLINMITQCMKNTPRERPSIQQVIQWLEQARADADDGEYDTDKLALIQLLQHKNQQITRLQQESENKQRQIDNLKEKREMVCRTLDSMKMYVYSLQVPPPEEQERENIVEEEVCI